MDQCAFGQAANSIAECSWKELFASAAHPSLSARQQPSNSQEVEVELIGWLADHATGICGEDAGPAGQKAAIPLVSRETIQIAFPAGISVVSTMNCSNF